MHLCLPGHKHTTQIFYDNVKSSDTSGFSIKNTYNTAKLSPNNYEFEWHNIFCLSNIQPDIFIIIP